MRGVANKLFGIKPLAPVSIFLEIARYAKSGHPLLYPSLFQNLGRQERQHRRCHESELRHHRRHDSAGRRSSDQQNDVVARSFVEPEDPYLMNEVRDLV